MLVSCTFKYFLQAVISEKFSLPYLILISTRQEKSVNVLLDYLENNPIDAEQAALLANIFQYDIPGHMGRGYIVLGK